MDKKESRQCKDAIVDPVVLFEMANREEKEAAYPQYPTFEEAAERIRKQVDFSDHKF